MLTCLTPLNYIVTGSFSAYPKPDYNTFSDRLVRCSLSESRYVINWAGSLLKIGKTIMLGFLSPALRFQCDFWIQTKWLYYGTQTHRR